MPKYRDGKGRSGTEDEAIFICVAIAKAISVAKIRIKQFLAIRLSGKVVAGPCLMAMLLFFIKTLNHVHARTELREESPAGAIDTVMKTFHEWLAERTKNEELWLNDKNAMVGTSNINPLLQKKAKLGVVKTPKPFKAITSAAFKPTPIPW